MKNFDWLGGVFDSFGHITCDTKIVDKIDYNYPRVLFRTYRGDVIKELKESYPTSAQLIGPVLDGEYRLMYAENDTEFILSAIASSSGVYAGLAKAALTWLLDYVPQYYLDPKSPIIAQAIWQKIRVYIPSHI